MNRTTGKVLRYVALPEILPRLQRIFVTGFACLSFYMASVMNIARLLPDNHPYLSPSNYGRFGIHHVLLQAWKNLEFKRKNTDQIIIYFTLASGVILLFLQMALFVMAFIVPAASAGVGAEFARFFVTDQPNDDLAFMFLDRVFGMENIFGSRVTGEAGWPTNFHEGLHELFGYYNTGLAIVAFLIILYFVITLTGETAQTGTPFGRRFNKAMAPLRLIIAIGLLVPITNGMSIAQIGTLYMAKWGSSMATNGWITFLDEVKGSTILGDPDTLVITPKQPMVNSLVEFMFVAVTCRYAYELSTENEPAPIDRFMIRPYVILPDDGFMILGEAASDLQTILGMNNNQNITIRIGEQNAEDYPELPSYVMPLCGEIEIDIQDLTEPGALYVQNAYLVNLLAGLWNDPPNNDFARNMVRSRLSAVNDRDPNLPDPSQQFVADTFDYFNDQTLNDIQEGVLAAVNDSLWDEDFTKYGWGGAAIWYNTIAKVNGSLVSSVFNLPVPKKYPAVMEEVLELKKAQNNSVAGLDRFNPVTADGTPLFGKGTRKDVFANLFYDAQRPWMQTQDAGSDVFFKDGINSLLGLQGLIDMRDNADIHPLAQLVGIGRSLIESAKQNFGYTAVTWVGGMAKDPSLSTLSKNAHKFFRIIMMFGLSIGFVLYYVLPFLPFIYFFVALTNWVKTIFEAMVGLPLWALSHIRIEGDGLPGPAAMNGYYLIFEIFVNPILIVLGMLAGITIFSAQVVVLNDIWGLVMTNVTGIDPATVDAASADKVGSVRYVRGVFDKFFYTGMYAVMVYMMGLASFKLVDAIPDRILRWLGTSVKSFNETAESMASELVAKSYQASQSVVDGADGVMNQMLLRNK